MGRSTCFDHTSAVNREQSETAMQDAISAAARQLKQAGSGSRSRHDQGAERKKEVHTEGTAETTLRSESV